MTNLALVKIDEEMAELKNKIALLEKMREEEEKKPRLKISYSHFDKKLLRLRITLSMYNEYVVDALRYMPSRQVIEGGTANTLSLVDLIAFKQRLHNVDHDDEWSPSELSEEIKEIVNKPNLTIELGPDKKKIYIYPNIFTQNFWPRGIDSFQKTLVDRFYTIDVLELWRLPLCIKTDYSHYTVHYSDGAIELLEEQIKRRDLVTELGKATDAEIDIPLIGGELFHGFQRVAVKFAQQTGFNCILALDMGLGKTPIAISIAEILKARVLFVVPATLKTNTLREIKKWTNKDSLVLSGASPAPVDVDALLNENKKKQYNIINFDVIGRETKLDKSLPDSATDNTIMKWVELINASKFDLIVVDEAHYIKNMTSLRSKGVRSLKSPHKVGLTGTPIVNRPSELYPILNMVSPTKFSRETEFLNSFMNRDGTPRNVGRLHEMLQDYMFRRRKEDVIKELPPISRLNHFVSLSDKANQHYEKAMQGLYIALKNPNYQREINGILAQLTRLKQIIADDKVEGTADLAIRAQEETGQKVLIFSQFVDTCASIKQLLPDSLIITGLNNDEERYERIDKFQQDPQYRFMVLSTKAGSEGLTLTAAHTVIFNDLCWTPKDHRQAEARCYGRMSDMHGAIAYYVQAEETIDEMIMQLIQKKLAIIEEVIDDLHENQGQGESIVSELLEMLKRRGR